MAATADDKILKIKILLSSTERSAHPRSTLREIRRILDMDHEQPKKAIGK